MTVVPFAGAMQDALEIRPTNTGFVRHCPAQGWIDRSAMWDQTLNHRLRGAAALADREKWCELACTALAIWVRRTRFFVGQSAEVAVGGAAEALKCIAAGL